jgi:hypothetical protein
VFKKKKKIGLKYSRNFDSIPVRTFYIVTKQKNMNGHSIPISCIFNNIY